ncbi:hypothetical protein A0257_03420 [Hymenobacter psoromatis]|nr:hypothetical protein A0257_03420 [Hymenobacter psoromatis]
MKVFLLFISTAAVLLHAPQAAWGQAAPPLGAAASFALFTAVGEIKNAGPTIVNGNIGTNAGAFTGFPPGVVNNGSIYVATTYSTQAATDVQTAYQYFSDHIPCATPLAIYGGTPAVTLIPGSYCVSGATTLAGTLILDAGGVANAKFYLRVIGGALTTAANSTVVLAGGATADNVYWQISGGAVNLGQNSTMQGTLLVDGAISMDEGTTLVGRGLSRAGAILPTSTPTFISTFSLPVPTSTSWLGTALGGLNTDWYTAANWSNGVPTSVLEAIVPTGTTPYPVIASGSAAAKSLTIGSTASLTQAGGALDVKNAIDNSGTISATGGTVTLTGATAQAIGGSGRTQLWSLTIANGVGATQTGTLSIHGVLALTSGGLNTNGQPLTLLSDAAGTALVVNTNGSVTGPATMQRAIDPTFNAGVGYHHYSSPMVSTTLGDLTTTPGFSPIFNTAYNTAAMPKATTPFPNVFAYDQARVTTSGNPGSQDFDLGFFVPADANTTMTPLVGYDLNIAASSTVDLMGTLNNGPVAISNLNRGTQTQSGWQLLGNPYPSPIDFSQTVGIASTNMDNAVYVYQSTGQYVGQYRSYVNGMGGSPQVAAMQGFFMRATTPNQMASLALTNDSRVTTFATTPSFNRTAADTRPQVRLRLQGSTPLIDEAYVYFEKGATADFDSRFDAYKLPNSSGLSVGSLITSNELSVNGLPPITGSTTVSLNVQVPAVGTYALNALDLLNFDASTQVYLLDNQTGARIDLSKQPLYSFTASATALPGRFVLLFGPNTPLAATPSALAQQVQLFPNPAHGSFTLVVPAELGHGSVSATLYNHLGQVVTKQTLPLTAAGATAQFDVSYLTAGVYTLQLKTGENQVVKRVVVTN